MKKIFSKSACLILLFLGCSNHNEIQQKLLDSYNNSTEEEYFAKVIELNGQYPENFYVNIELGYIYLMNMDFEKAEKAFDVAMENRIKKDYEWNYKLFGGISDLHYAQEKWQSSIDSGLVALENLPGDSSGIKLTMARSFAQLDNIEQSFDYYKEIFSEHIELLKYSDWNNISEMSIYFQDFEFTYNLWMEYWKRHGYEPGLGLRISVLSGKLGRIDESLITGFIDLDFQLAYKLIGHQETVDFIEKISRYEVDENLLKGLSAYTNSDWQRASELLKTKQINNPVYSFFELNSQFELETIDRTELTLYLALEPYFYNHPSYYKRILEYGMEIEKYDKLSLTELVLLYSDTNTADYYRKELGINQGLDPESIEYFLVKPEVENHILKYKKDGDLQHLKPIVQFLNIPDVYSTDAAIDQLKVLSRDPIVKKFLNLVLNESEGILKARLNSILEI